MSKTILITGATDGIGLAAAKMLIKLGHNILVHGRNPDKLNQVKLELSKLCATNSAQSYLCDLANLADVVQLANTIKSQHQQLDVLINNAGVFKISQSINTDGLDVRFVVNTLAPYLLSKKLLALLKPSGRIINLSSAAQAPVNLQALLGKVKLSDMEAYAQSKLAITQWTRYLALQNNPAYPCFIAVNPGSLLGSKMVKEGFGIDGGDLDIGAKILTRLAIDEDSALHSGEYFDNDKGQFSALHPDAVNEQKTQALVDEMNAMLAAF